MDSSSNDSNITSSNDDSWTDWFMEKFSQNYFCEIDRAYISDSFNLYGLNQYFNEFRKILNIILENIDMNDDDISESNYTRLAPMLYGLIHARYIITTNGLNQMRKKYQSGDFGECPRAYCNGQHVLPVGLFDEPSINAVKLFCPNCQDVFNCPAKMNHIDGAYFGTTFPHIFFMTFDNLVPSGTQMKYIPRVFGFKIHPTSNSVPNAFKKNDNKPSAKEPLIRSVMNAAFKEANKNGEVYSKELLQNVLDFLSTEANCLEVVKETCFSLLSKFKSIESEKEVNGISNKRTKLDVSTQQLGERDDVMNNLVHNN